MSQPSVKPRPTSAPRWLVAVSVGLVAMLASALGIVRATNGAMADVPRVSVVTTALSPASDGFENYLLVGSDSRAGADPNEKISQILAPRKTIPDFVRTH